MPFLKTLMQSEEQTASSRVLTRIADSISYDDNIAFCDKSRHNDFGLGLVYLFNGISTSYGLLNAKI